MVESLAQKAAHITNAQEAGWEAAKTSKLGEPDDVAYMVLYLASDESKFINGAEMVIDNSMTVTAGTVPA